MKRVKAKLDLAFLSWKLEVSVMFMPEFLNFFSLLLKAETRKCKLGFLDCGKTQLMIFCCFLKGIWVSRIEERLIWYFKG